jgi:nucleotide-binding universal stress UspA family protein
MFKHLLIPTDGSELSKEAVRSGIRLAHELGAKVTALYVMPDYNALIYGAEALLTINAAEFDAHVQKYADKALHLAEHLAREQNVPCATVRTASASIYRAIVKQAQDLDCDLICMASHGRKGISELLLGSETQKVLTHSSIPVLVHRAVPKEREKT